MMKQGAYPLDMSQFKNLFSSTRIPCQRKDKLKIYNGSKHIVVLYKGNFYSLSVLDSNGDVMDANMVRTSLNWIKKNSSNNVEGFCDLIKLYNL